MFPLPQGPGWSTSPPRSHYVLPAIKAENNLQFPRNQAEEARNGTASHIFILSPFMFLLKEYALSVLLLSP